MTTPPWRATIGVGALFLASLLAGAWTGARAADRARDPYAPLDTLARALTLVERNYVEEVPLEALVEHAIDGMLEPLDPHSQWFTADEYRAFQAENEGSYQGIGVEVRTQAEGVWISRVLPGGPAERDGLLADDLLLAVDGKPLAGLDLDEVAALLKGPRGTPVKLTVRRAGWDAPRELSTVRDRIYTPALEVARLPGEVGYIRLIQFQEELGAELGRSIEGLDAPSPLRGLVLDLRDNPGGLLDEAVAVVDLFQDEGVIVSTRSRIEGEVVHTATPGGVRPDLRVAVLVNGMSASASEIVAAALQDTGRARLFGVRTYGKGSVQSVFANRDQSALKLTIGRYYTPSGAPIGDRAGREPDVVVRWPASPSAKDALRARLSAAALPEEERDALLALVEQLNADPSEEARIPWGQPPASRLEADPQLKAAVGWIQAP